MFSHQSKCTVRQKRASLKSSFLKRGWKLLLNYAACCCRSLAAWPLPKFSASEEVAYRQFMTAGLCTGYCRKSAGKVTQLTIVQMKKHCRLQKRWSMKWGWKAINKFVQRGCSVSFRYISRPMFAIIAWLATHQCCVWLSFGVFLPPCGQKLPQQLFKAHPFDSSVAAFPQGCDRSLDYAFILPSPTGFT